MQIENVLKDHPELMQAPIGLLEVLMINPKEPGDLEDTLLTILRANLDLLAADACSISLINPITGQFLEKYSYINETGNNERLTSERPQLDRLTQDAVDKLRPTTPSKTVKDRIWFIDNLDRHRHYSNPFEGPPGAIQSVAIVSLLTHRKREPMPLALLFLGFAKRQDFSKEKQSFLRLLADQASSALQHTWSLRRYKEVARIGYEINQELKSVEGVFEKLRMHVPGILDTKYFFMMTTHDVQRNKLNYYLIEKGKYKHMPNRPFKAACASVIQSQKPLSVRDYGAEKDELPNQVISLLKGTEPIIPNSLEFMPLKFREVTLGVLSIQQTYRNAYDEEDRHILELLANHVALALTNLRLFDSLTRLNVAGQKLTSGLNSEHILDAVADSTSEVLRADLVALYPYAREKDLFEFPIHFSGKLKYPDLPIPNYSRPDDIATLTLKRTEPVFAVDSSQLYAELGGDPACRRGNFEKREKICSTAALPLRVAGEPVGVLFVNFRSKQHFKPAQRQLIEGMANYAAIAIKNAREFGSLAQKRLTEMQILRDIDRAISKTLNLEKILQTILEQATHYMSKKGEQTLNGAILILNPRNERLEVKAASGPDAHLRHGKSISLREKKGIINWATQINAPARVGDVHEQKWEHLYFEVDRKTVSELDVPLLDENDTVIGVISFESDRKDRFSQDDQDFLTTLANQAVLAIKNAQAYEREKQAKEAQDVIQRVERRIVSELDFEKVAEYILDEALQLTRSNAGQVFLHEEKGDYLYMAAARGVLRGKMQERTPVNKGIAGWVFTNKKPLNVNISEPPWDEIYVRMIRDVSWELAVPMLRGDTPLGVINIESTKPFTEHDEQLLLELADLAVIAFSNARSYTQEREAVKRFQFLYKAAQELGKIADLEQLEDAYRVVVKIFADHREGQIAIRRLDEEKKELVLVHEARPPQTKPLFPRMSIDEGANGWVARHLKTLNIGDTENPPEGVEPKASDPGTRSLVITPIKLRDVYYGNLALSHRKTHYFRQEDVELIKGLAQQLALTINRLEEVASKQEAQRLAKESEMMSSIGQSAYELTHRLGNDLGLVEPYIDRISRAMGKNQFSDPVVDENLNRILSRVGKVLEFNGALKKDVQALEDGNAAAVPAEVPLLTVLIDAEAIFPSLPDNIQLVREFEDDLPTVRVVASQIANILFNLVSNAKDELEKLGGGGSITVRAKKVGNMIEIEVQDTGRGIPASLRPRIFRLFYSTKGSSGFGLWSARRNALANGGDLRVDDKVKKGACFVLSLPYVVNS